MSAPRTERTRPARGASFTMRLTPDDQTRLYALCQHYRASRPDSLRRAMRAVLSALPVVPDGGLFHPVPGIRPFSIRFRRKTRP